MRYNGISIHFYILLLFSTRLVHFILLSIYSHSNGKGSSKLLNHEFVILLLKILVILIHNVMRRQILDFEFMNWILHIKLHRVLSARSVLKSTNASKFVEKSWLRTIINSSLVRLWSCVVIFSSIPFYFTPIRLCSINIVNSFKMTAQKRFMRSKIPVLLLLLSVGLVHLHIRNTHSVNENDSQFHSFLLKVILMWHASIFLKCDWLYQIQSMNSEHTSFSFDRWLYWTNNFGIHLWCLISYRGNGTHQYTRMRVHRKYVSFLYFLFLFLSARLTSFFVSQTHTNVWIHASWGKLFTTFSHAMNEYIFTNLDVHFFSLLLSTLIDISSLGYKQYDRTCIDVVIVCIIWICI